MSSTYSTFTNSRGGGRKVPALALGVVAALALAGVVISNGVNQSKTVTPTDLKSKSGDDWDDSASKARTNTIAFKQSDCDPSVAAGSPLDIMRRFKVVSARRGSSRGDAAAATPIVHDRNGRSRRRRRGDGSATTWIVRQADRGAAPKRRASAG